MTALAGIGFAPTSPATAHTTDETADGLSTPRQAGSRQTIITPSSKP